MKSKSKKLKSTTIKKTKLNTDKRMFAKNAKKENIFNKIHHLDLITEDVWNFMNEDFNLKEIL